MKAVTEEAVSLVLLVLAPGAMATTWPVIAGQQTIQETIEEPLVVDGDTLSLWGEGSPPFVFRENVDLRGKALCLANACYLPDPPAPPCMDDVVVDGQGLSPVFVVHMLGSAHSAELRGLSVVNGCNGLDEGGGVVSRQSSLVIQNCHIHGNQARLRGGGVFWLGVEDQGLILRSNVIEGNVAEQDGGGGVAIEYSGAVATVWVEQNEFLYNEADKQGGGLSLTLAGSDPPSDWPPVSTINDNLFGGNSITGCNPNESEGGAVYARSWYWGARRNILVENDPDGIVTTQSSGGWGPLNLGWAGDPGYNVFKGNGERNLFIRYSGGTGYAAGNYWHHLDTPAILSRIESYCTFGLELDPVAASGKHFSVAENAHCQTGVIVSGDLVVEPGVDLLVDPGKRLEFWLDPDYSVEGGDPELCELVIDGPGGSLHASGTPDDSIQFTSRRNMEPGVPGDWYGI